MPVSFNWDGLEKFKRKIESIEGEKQITLSELFTDDFIRQHTNYQTLQAMFDAGGIKSAEEIKSDEFLKFISLHTKFTNWEEMLKAATTAYCKRQLET